MLIYYPNFNAIIKQYINCNDLNLQIDPEESDYVLSEDDHYPICEQI